MEQQTQKKVHINHSDTNCNSKQTNNEKLIGAIIFQQKKNNKIDKQNNSRSSNELNFHCHFFYDLIRLNINLSKYP